METSDIDMELEGDVTTKEMTSKAADFVSEMVDKIGPWLEGLTDILA